MEKDYVPRRTSSSPQRRQPTTVRSTTYQRRSSGYGGGPRRSNRRRSGPPPILPIAVILVLLIVVVVVLVMVFGGNRDSEPGGNSSQVVSSVSSGLTSDAPTPSPEPTPTPEPTPPPQDEPSIPPEQLGALLQVGDTGYEYYNFVTDTANEYITMVSEAGEQISDFATLYDMVIPTSMDIMLPESYIEKYEINTSDQRKAIEEYIFPSVNAMNPDVKTVSIFDALKLHSNEYIYFRTDHHWTQLGAYYAYVEFCNAKGITPTPLEGFDKKEYPGFLGSFYSDSQSAEMSANPDTVEAYVPQADTHMYVMQNNGEALEDWPVVQDGTDYSSENKYLIFIAGDQPYEEITNNDLTDNSTCVVVKESFGNAFVPFLVNHYQHIYVVDYRYYDGNIADLAREKGATDVLLLNNISMTRNADLVASISNRF